MFDRAAIFLSMLAGLCLASCGAEISPKSASDSAPANTRPQRIVSLDFCADQYVLKFAAREHILAISPDAAKPFSYMSAKAAGIDKVNSSAENVIILKPDLVVRSYGGGPNAEAFFARAGVPVLNVGWAGDIDGIKRVTAQMANGLGAPKKGEALIAEIDARLSALPQPAASRRVLYMTPSGTTTGAGSLVHEMITIAGLDNFETQPGWRSLPLERLAYARPDMIAAAFFDTNPLEKDAWSAMRHPVARRQITDLPTVALSGSSMSCGAWFALDAIEALAGQEYIEGAL